MAKNVVIQKPPSLLTPNDPGFFEDKFDELIWHKGYQVVHEKMLECPCKSVRVNNLSNCKNCGGTGYIFINPEETRMVLRSMNENTTQKTWTKENIGTVSISTMNRNQLSDMDRITIINAEARFHEVRHFRMSQDNQLFAYCSYNIKKILYMGLFIDENTPLQRLKEDVDFTFDGNRIFLDNSYNSKLIDDNSLSVTLRYIHFPQYYVIDLPRQIAISRDTNENVEEVSKLPLAGIGRRAHFVLDVENIEQNRLLNNSFIDDSCNKQIKTVDQFSDLSCCNK